MKMIPCTLISVCSHLFSPCENITMNCSTRIVDLKDSNVFHTFVANHSSCLFQKECESSKKWIEQLSGAMAEVAQQAIEKGYQDLMEYEPLYITLGEHAPCLLFQNAGRGIVDMISSFTKWLKTYKLIPSE